MVGWRKKASDGDANEYICAGSDMDLHKATLLTRYDEKMDGVFICIDRTGRAGDGGYGYGC